MGEDFKKLSINEGFWDGRDDLKGLFRMIDEQPLTKAPPKVLRHPSSTRHCPPRLYSDRYYWSIKYSVPQELVTEKCMKKISVKVHLFLLFSLLEH